MRSRDVGLGQEGKGRVEIGIATARLLQMVDNVSDALSILRRASNSSCSHCDIDRAKAPALSLWNRSQGGGGGGDNERKVKESEGKDGADLD
jgi:hypothetical protein